MTDEIKHTLAIIPHQPGCYQFYDEQGTVIYVGKAKPQKGFLRTLINIMKNQNTHSRSKNSPDKIHCRQQRGGYVSSENNLIKELQPRYNVL